MLRKILAGAALAAGLIAFHPTAGNAIVVSPPGGSAFNPLVVSPNTNGQYIFSNASSGLWYDPPFVNGFTYAVTGTTFSSVTTPPVSLGFGPVELFLAGVDSGAIAAGASSTLVNGATSFELLGINPVLDQGAAGFAKAYPVQLFFPGTAGTLTITPIPAVPEPVSVSLFAGALGILAFVRRSRIKG